MPDEIDDAAHHFPRARQNMNRAEADGDLPADEQNCDECDGPKPDEWLQCVRPRVALSSFELKRSKSPRCSRGPRVGIALPSSESRCFDNRISCDFTDTTIDPPCFR